MVMTKEEFKQYLKENIKEYLPDNFMNAAITFEEVQKGGLQYDAMIIKADWNNIVPRVYINGDYEEYRNGGTLDAAVTNLALTTKKAYTEAETINVNDMKNNIAIKIVNREENLDLINIAPHKVQEDMLITYRWVALESEDGIGSALITNEIMKNHGLDIEGLHNLALENTMRMFPARIGSMEQMFLGESMPIEEFDLSNVADGGFPMFVITNQQKINGAATLLYPGFLDQVAEKFGSNIYLLPSSIHETIVLPDNVGMGIKQLQNLVRSVNEDIVESQDKLSDQVFYYDRDSKSLTRAGEKEMNTNKEFVDFFLRQNSEVENEYTFDDPEFEP